MLEYDGGIQLFICAAPSTLPAAKVKSPCKMN
jgi:hypothetical protein